MKKTGQSDLSTSISIGCYEFWRERGESSGFTFKDLMRAGARFGKRKQSKAAGLADRIARELEGSWETNQF